MSLQTIPDTILYKIFLEAIISPSLIITFRSLTKILLTCHDWYDSLLSTRSLMFWSWLFSRLRWDIMSPSLTFSSGSKIMKFIQAIDFISFEPNPDFITTDQIWSGSINDDSDSEYIVSYFDSYDLPSRVTMTQVKSNKQVSFEPALGSSLQMPFICEDHMLIKQYGFDLLDSKFKWYDIKSPTRPKWVFGPDQDTPDMIYGPYSIILTIKYGDQDKVLICESDSLKLEVMIPGKWLLSDGKEPIFEMNRLTGLLIWSPEGYFEYVDLINKDIRRLSCIVNHYYSDTITICCGENGVGVCQIINPDDDPTQIIGFDIHADKVIYELKYDGRYCTPNILDGLVCFNDGSQIFVFDLITGVVLKRHQVESRKRMVGIRYSDKLGYVISYLKKKSVD